MLEQSTIAMVLMILPLIVALYTIILLSSLTHTSLEIAIARAIAIMFIICQSILIQVAFLPNTLAAMIINVLWSVFSILVMILLIILANVWGKTDGIQTKS